VPPRTDPQRCNASHRHEPSPYAASASAPSPTSRSYCWDELLLPAIAGVGARDPAGHSGARAPSASRAKLHDATVHPAASSGACAREELRYINGDVIFGGERMDPHECGDGSLDVAVREETKRKQMDKSILLFLRQFLFRGCLVGR
jgi:hypothetical protein